MKWSSSLQAKIGLILVLAGVSVLAASSGNQGARRVETRIDGPSRATSVNPASVTLAMQQGGSRPAAPAQPQAASARPAARPTAAQKAAVAARKPIRRIHDEYPQYSAVAVDMERNEVVMADENLFQMLV